MIRGRESLQFINANQMKCLNQMHLVDLHGSVHLNANLFIVQSLGIRVRDRVTNNQLAIASTDLLQGLNHPPRFRSLLLYMPFAGKFTHQTMMLGRSLGPLDLFDWSATGM